jgi:hypothetical protein
VTNSPHRTYPSGVRSILQPRSGSWMRPIVGRGLIAGALAYQVVVYLGAGSPGTPNAQGIGLRNVLVVGLFPFILALLGASCGAGKQPRDKHHRLAMPYGLLLGCVALGSFWSPFPTAGFKQVAYLAAFGLLFHAYSVMGERFQKWTPYLAVWSLVAGLVTAGVQTFVLSNAYGALSGRATAFVAPQAFGLAVALLVAILVYFNRAGRLPLALAAPLVGLGMTGLLLNGGRQAFVAGTGVLILSAIPLGFTVKRQALVLPITSLLAAVLCVTMLQGIGPPAVAQMLSERSVSALLYLTTDDMQETGDAGTARQRLEIWRALGKRLEEQPTRFWLHGHGTSSAGSVIADGDIQYRDYDQAALDPNRIAHNEFLRALYEWGILGVSFLAWICLAVLGRASVLFRNSLASTELLLLAIAAIAFLGLPLLGNTLATTSGPLGVVLVLVCTEIFRPRPNSQ